MPIVHIVAPGDRFNDWAVLELRPNKIIAGKSFRMALCQCVCGTTRVVIINNLTRPGGRTSRSCGCSHIKHGMSQRREYGYGVWASMKNRCLDPNNAYFHLYGGRGITVCKRWIDSFADFLADMGPRPSKQYSIDRYPDNNGNYEPGNCRWATTEEQMSNTRQNCYLEYDGRSMTVKQWSNERGIPYDALRGRLRRGDSAERALSIPYIHLKSLHRQATLGQSQP